MPYLLHQTCILTVSCMLKLGAWIETLKQAVLSSYNALSYAVNKTEFMHTLVQSKIRIHYLWELQLDCQQSGLPFAGPGATTAASPDSSCFSSRNSAAASRIRLNSMQKAWTSINSSCKSIVCYMWNFLYLCNWKQLHHIQVKKVLCPSSVTPHLPL